MPVRSRGRGKVPWAPYPGAPPLRARPLVRRESRAPAGAAGAKSGGDARPNQNACAEGHAHQFECYGHSYDAF